MIQLLHGETTLLTCAVGGGTFRMLLKGESYNFDLLFAKRGILAPENLERMPERTQMAVSRINEEQ